MDSTNYDSPTEAKTPFSSPISIEGVTFMYPQYFADSACEEILRSNVRLHPCVSDPQVQSLPSLAAIIPAGATQDYLVKLLEDVTLFVFNLSRSKSFADAALAVVGFLKYRSSTALITSERVIVVIDKFRSVFSNSVQSDIGDTFSTLRGMLDNYENLRSSPIFTKLKKFTLYLLSLSLLEPIGVDFSNFMYNDVEAAYIKQTHRVGADFVHCMLDTCLFICEKGYQCYRLGSFEAIVLCGSAYEEWHNCYTKLMACSRNIYAMPYLGVSFNEYVTELNGCIETGENFLKYTLNKKEHDAKLIARCLNDLKEIRSVRMAREATQKNRVAPMVVSFCGGQGIGKSNLTDQTIKLISAIDGHKVQTSDVYYVNSDMDHYDGAQPGQKYCVIDEFASKPVWLKEVDKSVANFLCTVNSKPYPLKMASLEAKGLVAATYSLVVITSNRADLGFAKNLYFESAGARRVTCNYRVRVKPEFADENGEIRPDLIDHPPDQFGDYHIFEKMGYKVRESDPTRVDYFVEKCLTHAGFVVDVCSSYKAHKAKQIRMLESVEDYDKIPFCDTHCRPKYMCECSGADPALEYTIEPTGPAVQDGVLDTSFISAMRPVPYTWLESKLHSFVTWFSLTRIGNFVLLIPGAFTTFAFMIWYLGFQRVSFHMIGERMKNVYVARPKFILSIMAAIATAAIVAKVVGSYRSVFTIQGGDDEDGIDVPPDTNPKTNVWYDPDVIVTKPLVTKRSASMKALSHTKMMEYVARATVRVLVHRPHESGIAKRLAIGTCIIGRIFLFNNHCIAEHDSVVIEVTFDNKKAGLTRNFVETITQSDVVRMPEMDLCLVKFSSINVATSILDLFRCDDHRWEGPAKYCGRTLDGDQVENAISRTRFTGKTHFPSMSKSIDCFLSNVERPTEAGDCGSPLLCHTSVGPVILGIHVALASDDKALAISVTRAHIDAMLAKLTAPVIQAGALPHLDNISELHAKSVFRYLESGRAEVFGSTQGFRPKQGGCVERSMIADYLETNYGFQKSFFTPVMNGWRPIKNIASRLTARRANLDPVVVDIAAACYTKHVLAGLSQRDAEILVPLTLTSSINGIPCVDFIDRMPMSTSAGYPYTGPKYKTYVKHDVPDDGYSVTYSLPDEAREMYEHALASIKSGATMGMIYTQSMKLEGVSKKKVDEQRTRSINGIGMIGGVLMRKYFLTSVKVACEHRSLFRVLVGINCQGYEWNVVQRDLSRFKNCFAGDYKNFDTSLNGRVLYRAWDVVMAMYDWAGATEQQQLPRYALIEDVVHALVIVNGDFARIFEQNPSGHNLTTLINCLVNVILMLYCWIKCGYDPNDFWDNTVAYVYGDDYKVSVADGYERFNHVSVTSHLAEANIIHTMADKDAESIPYLDSLDGDILKRSSVYNERFDVYMGALDKKSIEKMLMIHIQSKTESKEVQTVGSIRSAVREAFAWGEETFNYYSRILKEAMIASGLEDYIDSTVFPTYECMCEQYQATIDEYNKVVEVQSLDIFSRASPEPLVALCVSLLLRAVDVEDVFLLVFNVFVLIMSMRKQREILPVLPQERVLALMFSYMSHSLGDTLSGSSLKYSMCLCLQYAVRIYSSPIVQSADQRFLQIETPEGVGFVMRELRNVIRVLYEEVDNLRVVARPQDGSDLWAFITISNRVLTNFLIDLPGLEIPLRRGVIVALLQNQIDIEVDSYCRDGWHPYLSVGSFRATQIPRNLPLFSGLPSQHPARRLPLPEARPGRYL